MSTDNKEHTATLRHAYYRDGIYILRPDEQLVSIFSQQVRALKLVRALYREKLEHEKGTRVAVIGGGAAGLTVAAAAALVNTEVTLFEQSRTLMPLQIGCATRALHPHIHHWPADPAYRAVSHLPILGWTAGTAHEVAQEIVGKFEEIKHFVNRDQDHLKVEHARATVRPGELGGRPRVFWEKGKEDGEDFDIVIVAVGFGIEHTVNELPLTSYWRVDPLGQPALMGSHQYIVISGAGDGGLIDILRAMITNFDHGTFYDEVLLRLKPVQQRIFEIEKAAWARFREVYQTSSDNSHQEKKNQALAEADKLLKNAYEGHAEAIRNCLGQEERPPIELNHDCSIHWLFRTCEYQVTAFPLNRLLVWYIRDYLERNQQSRSPQTFRHTLGSLTHVALLDQEVLGGPRYEVTITTSDGTQRELVHYIVVRHGARSALKSTIRDAPEQIDDWLKATPPTYPDDRAHLIPLLRWDQGDGVNNNFAQAIDEARRTLQEVRQSSKPTVTAIFFRDEHNQIVSNKGVYRIRVQLKGELRHIRWVTYDLHPEQNRVERKSTRHPFEQWINSKADFRIRVRLSDGREVSEWLVQALKEGEKGKEDAEREILKLEDAQSPFIAIRKWASDLKASPPSEASPPQEYLGTGEGITS